jgi:DNA-binding FadR family transcriptional regulator
MILAAQPETLEHLKEARLMFEVGMAKIAAARAGDSDIAKLRGHVDALEANLSNPAKFLDEDMAFHTQIAAISGNAICAVISQAMLRWLREFRSELVAVPGRELVTIAEHRRILAGIESRDPAAAEAAMTAHLTRAGSVYRSPAAAG